MDVRATESDFDIIGFSVLIGWSPKKGVNLPGQGYPEMET